MGPEPGSYLNMVGDSATRWRRHAVSSSIVLAAAVAAVYAVGFELPLLSTIRSPGYRPFLWIIPLFASFGLVLAAIARGRLQHRAWRFAVATICAAVLLFWLVRAIRVAATGLSGTFLAALFALGVYGWLCWLLTRRAPPPTTTSRMLETIAIMHGIGPILAVLLGSVSRLEGVIIITLASVPLILVILAFLIATGSRKAIAVNGFIFAALFCIWLASLFLSLPAGGLDPAAAPRLWPAKPVVSALFAFANLCFALVNLHAWRQSRSS
jgi:hypothetical protein